MGVVRIVFQGTVPASLRIVVDAVSPLFSAPGGVPAVVEPFFSPVPLPFLLAGGAGCSHSLFSRSAKESWIVPQPLPARPFKGMGRSVRDSGPSMSSASALLTCGCCRG